MNVFVPVVATTLVLIVLIVLLAIIVVSTTVVVVAPSHQPPTRNKKHICTQNPAIPTAFLHPNQSTQESVQLPTAHISPTPEPQPVCNALGASALRRAHQSRGLESTYAIFPDTPPKSKLV